MLAGVPALRGAHAAGRERRPLQHAGAAARRAAAGAARHRCRRWWRRRSRRVRPRGSPRRGSSSASWSARGRARPRRRRCWCPSQRRRRRWLVGAGLAAALVAVLLWRDARPRAALPGTAAGQQHPRPERVPEPRRYAGCGRRPPQRRVAPGAAASARAARDRRVRPARPCCRQPAEALRRRLDREGHLRPRRRQRGRGRPDARRSVGTGAQGGQSVGARPGGLAPRGGRARPDQSVRRDPRHPLPGDGGAAADPARAGYRRPRASTASAGDPAQRERRLLRARTHASAGPAGECGLAAGAGRAREPEGCARDARAGEARPVHGDPVRHGSAAVPRFDRAASPLRLLPPEHRTRRRGGAARAPAGRRLAGARTVDRPAAWFRGGLHPGPASAHRPPPGEPTRPEPSRRVDGTGQHRVAHRRTACRALLHSTCPGGRSPALARRLPRLQALRGGAAAGTVRLRHGGMHRRCSAVPEGAPVQDLRDQGGGIAVGRRAGCRDGAAPRGLAGRPREALAAAHGRRRSSGCTRRRSCGARASPTAVSGSTRVSAPAGVPMSIPACSPTPPTPAWCAGTSTARWRCRPGRCVPIR